MYIKKFPTLDVPCLQASVVDFPAHGGRAGAAAAAVGLEGRGRSEAAAPGPQEATALGKRWEPARRPAHSLVLALRH